MSDWYDIGIEYPPYNQPVLVSDGEFYQIRIFRLKEGIKYWECDHEKNMKYSAQYWTFLPKLPTEIKE